LTKEVHTRVDEKIALTWENDAKQLKISLSQWIIDACNHYLKCQKNGLFGNIHPIITQFDGYCTRCGQLVPKQTWALYSRGSGIICQSCYVSKLGDKETFLKELRVGELKREIKILEKQKAPLLETVLNLRAEQICRENLQKEKESFIKLCTLAQSFLNSLGNISGSEEKETIKRIQDAEKEHEELLQITKISLEDEIVRKNRKSLPPELQ
jgi:hypothetical protein